MTYIDDEKSVHDAEPVELYEFVGSATTYRLTSHVEDYTFMSNLYTAIPLERTVIKSNANLGRLELTVSMPVSQTLAQDYAFNVAPRDLELTVWRVHPFTGNNAKIWQGKVVAISVAGRGAKFLIPSVLSSGVESSLPNRFYQAQCNHRFGDTRCTIDLANHRYNTTVIALNPDDITIGIANAIPGPAGWATGGELIRITDGERRLVMESEGKTLKVNWPFRTLNITDVVQVVRGCDRSLRTCHVDFDNTDNYGGFPYVPGRNIFRIGLKAGE